MQAAEVWPDCLSLSAALSCCVRKAAGLECLLLCTDSASPEFRTVSWPMALAAQFMKSSGGGYLPTQGKLKKPTRLRQNRHLIQKVSNLIKSISDPDIWSTTLLLSHFHLFRNFNFLNKNVTDTPGAVL